jgi:hypothetical protein
VQAANEVAAAASPTVRAKSRRVITGHMLVDGKMDLQVHSAKRIARLRACTWIPDMLQLAPTR